MHPFISIYPCSRTSLSDQAPVYVPTEMQSQFSIFLEALSDLDLTGRVPRQPRIYVGRGGAGEIFKGELVPEETLNDGARAEAQVVAIKSIRAKLKEGNFEKVN